MLGVDYWLSYLAVCLLFDNSFAIALAAKGGRQQLATTSMQAT